ncbi:response regulator [Leptolyngbya sp. AN02str]|uniref:response regulator n=1 Tax=Leptolyngbya sp. AN02str TaxID=3423363 RepID=UPI003D324061
MQKTYRSWEKAFVNRKILVVDDEFDLQNLVKTCLEIMGGWQVVTAGSGAEALGKAQKLYIDVILLDLMMPEMDGLAVLQELRSRDDTNQIPVVLLTAKGQAIEADQFAHLKVLGIIKKPFDPMRLADQVDQLLSNELES